MKKLIIAAALAVAFSQIPARAILVEWEVESFSTTEITHWPSPHIPKSIEIDNRWTKGDSINSWTAEFVKYWPPYTNSDYTFVDFNYVGDYKTLPCTEDYWLNGTLTSYQQGDYSPAALYKFPTNTNWWESSNFTGATNGEPSGVTYDRIVNGAPGIKFSGDSTHVWDVSFTLTATETDPKLGAENDSGYALPAGKQLYIGGNGFTTDSAGKVYGNFSYYADGAIHTEPVTSPDYPSLHWIWTLGTPHQH